MRRFRPRRPRLRRRKRRPRSERIRERKVLVRDRARKGLAFLEMKLRERTLSRG